MGKIIFVYESANVTVRVLTDRRSSKPRDISGTPTAVL